MNLMGSSLDMGRISEFQDISIETCQNEMQRKKYGKKTNKPWNIHELWGNLKKCNMYIIGTHTHTKKKSEERKYLK